MFLRFAHPWFLLFLLVIPAVVWWRRRQGIHRVTLRFSDIRSFEGVAPSLKVRLMPLLTWLRYGALVLLVLALARPQSGLILEDVTSEGVDIMIALDVSGSMQALDYKPDNRLDVAKKVVEQFVQGRTNDRIGLVVFAGETYVQCPLTLDYGVLLNYLRENVEILMGVYRVGFREVPMIEDGTAIGSAVARSVKRLQDSEAKSKVVILVTDGSNNKGDITPEYAAEIAQALGVKVYTIGVGREEGVPQQINNPLFGSMFVPSGRSDLDVETLKRIAEMTEAKFYRATDPQAMEQAFQEIDALERTEIKVKEYEKFTELFLYFLIGALVLLALEVVLGQTFLRRIP